MQARLVPDVSESGLEDSEGVRPEALEDEADDEDGGASDLDALVQLQDSIQGIDNLEK